MKKIWIALLILLGVSAAQGQSSGLVYGSAVVGTISGSAPLAFYSFNGNEGDQITVRVIPVTSGFDPIVNILSPDQQIVGVNDNDPILGGVDVRLALTLAQTGVYSLLVSGVNGTTGDFVLLLEGSAAPPPVVTEAATPPLPPAETEESDLPPAPTTAAAPEVTLDVTTEVTAEPSEQAVAGCTVTIPDGVRVYQAPTTDSASLTYTATDDQRTYPAVQRTTDGMWYAVDLGGGLLWVSAAAATYAGDCAALPIYTQDEIATTETVEATATAQGVPSATYTATAQGVPSATYTPSYTPTTPPPPPVAPEDARFNPPLNIQLDSTASTTDFVSYPGGDTEDRISWNVNGMNPSVALPGGRARLILAVSCFGTGTQHVLFFTGGRTYGCGQTIVDQEVTFDIRTGLVTITAVGGENTYVQWVLTGTATRITGQSQPPAPLATVTPTTAPTATATATPTEAVQEQALPTATYTYTPSATIVDGQVDQIAPTATHTPTHTPTDGLVVTATYTATAPAEVTATYTPSYTPTTPPPPQVAPEDARFNSPLNIALDSTASVTDFISYPGGDTEDRVRWDIIGMNPSVAITGGRARLIIAVSCFGTGTQHVQFFTGGQTYSCGQTIVDQEVTNDSRTGSVVITAVGGENTYVQWVLTGTATRLN